MKTVVSLAAFAVGALSQATFEPADFNITEALLKNGVNVSAIPELASFAERSLSSGCSAALIFGDDQVETQSESAYTVFLNDFWSAQQAEISPQCVFKPEKALDVSTSILLSRLTQCPFAAKSGGHSAVPGGSNIEGGITISFERMNKTTPSDDRKSVSFQPGQTCVYGLSCDNVISFELVTATGVVITVSKTSYPDLFWALRGGGNNFGLVTQFNVNALPRADTMWGGSRTYLESEWPALLEAYINLGKQANQDGKAHQILSFVNYSGSDPIALVELEYADPVTNATILEEYNTIEGAIADTTAVRSLAELTTLIDGNGEYNGKRQAFWTWTTKLDLEMATLTKDIFYEEIASVKDVADFVGAVSLQVITDPILEKTKLNGGNALGLDPKDGPLALFLVSPSWSNSADDETVNQFAARVMDRCVGAAKAAGKLNDYLYMNYASPYQNPIGGYGAANQARLKAISKKYDPTGVFQTLQPGYFKLDGTAPLGQL
ncbi:FAD-binding domain-containing protein [Alternaria alternata]|nr:FAD-binding domain-containing protein [Alternaria alternata]